MKSLFFCSVSVFALSLFGGKDLNYSSKGESLIKKNVESKNHEDEIVIEREPWIISINENAQAILQLRKIDFTFDFDDLGEVLEKDVLTLSQLLMWRKEILLVQAKANKHKKISQLFWHASKSSFRFGVLSGVCSSIIAFSTIYFLCGNDDKTWNETCVNSLVLGRCVPPAICWSGSLSMYLGSSAFASFAGKQKIKVDILKSSYRKAVDLPLIQDEESEFYGVDITQLKNLLAKLEDKTVKQAFLDALNCLENQIEKENTRELNNYGQLEKIWNYFCGVLGQG